MMPSIRAPRRSSCSPSVGHQVDQPGHLAAAVAHRDVERQHLVAERRLGAGQHAVVVGARLVELGDHDGTRHADLGALAPQRGGGVVDGLAGGDHEQRAVGRAQPGAHLAHEVGVPGGVDEVDLGVAVDDRGDGQRDGALVGLLGVLEVADRRAFLDGPRAGDGSGGGEQRLDQGGLARNRPVRPAPRCGSGRGCSPRDLDPAGLRPPALSAMVCLQVSTRTADQPGDATADVEHDGSRINSVRARMFKRYDERRPGGEVVGARRADRCAAHRASVGWSRHAGRRENGASPSQHGVSEGLTYRPGACPQADDQSVSESRRSREDFRQTSRQ